MTTTNLPDMLESVHLRRFKGFRDTKIGPFRQVNLVLGGQNVGKTSLLEAIYVIDSFNVHNVGHVFRQSEGNDDARFLSSVFDQGFESISGIFSDGGVSIISRGHLNSAKNIMEISSGHALSWVWNGEFSHGPKVTPVSLHLPSQFIQSEIYSKIFIGRKKKDLISLLQQVEPNLEGLDSVSPDGEQRIYVELSHVPRAIPLPQLGHGFNRLFVLFSQMLVTEAKLVLIDEVENGIHYSALPTVFTGLRNVALDRGVQSIMTTHSWDAIRSACEVFADRPDIFQVIRLERTEDDNVKAVCIEGERMLRMMEREMEVR